MGRKNKITKTVETVSPDIDDIDENDDFQNEDEEFIKKDNTRTDIIWNTRNKILEYTEKYNYQLCEYLTFNVFEDYINFLQENN